MAIRGVGITVQYVAWNTSTNAGATGDAGNHTLRRVKDGVSAAPTNAPSEVDATNAPGVYSLALTAAEMTCDCITLCGKSSTANVVLMPLTITTEHGVLPTAQQGNAGAVPTGDASGRVTAAPTGLDAVLVAGKTLPHAIQIIGSVVAGTITDAGQPTEIFNDFAGTACVTFTVDAFGNRSAAVYAV